MKIYKSLVVIGAAALVGSLAACGDDPSSSAQNNNPTVRSATALPAIAVPLSVIQQAGGPSISGTPAPSVQAGEAYDFVPTASDPAGNTVTFSIQNKPAWASFNIMTGELSGTPAESDVGLYSDILISASDSAASTALTAFAVQVASTTGASSTPTISSSSTSLSTAASTSVATPVVAAVSAPTSAFSSGTASFGSASTSPALSTPTSTSVALPVLSALTPPASVPASTTSSSASTSTSSSSTAGSNSAASTSSSTSTSSSSTSSASSSSSSSNTGSSSTGAGAAGAPQYPRLSWENGIGNNGRPEVIARSAHLDVVILGDTFEGAAASNGYNRGNVVNQMLAGDGVVVPKVQQYVLDNAYLVNQQVAGLDPIWSAQMNAMPNWFLWNPTQGNNVHVQSDWLTNPVDLGAGWEDANGNNMEAAFAKYVDGYYRTGNTADAAPNLSGPWHDNLGGLNGAPQGNWLGNGPSSGTVYGSNNATVAAAYWAGQAKFVSWYRTHAPNQLVMGNLNTVTDLTDMPGVRLYNRASSALTASPLNGALDAVMSECAFGPASMEHYGGFEETRRMIQFAENFVKSPQYNMIVHDGINTSPSTQNGLYSGADSDLNASPGQALRYSFTATLVVTSGTHTVLDDLFWFDYYAVNPTTGVALDYASSTSAQIGASRYWLGTPIDAIQTAPTQGKVYARRFRMPNGRTALVLVNPSANGGNYGAAPQTINLTAAYGGSWTHITASNGSNVGNNPQVDNGATVTSVTVPVGDGVILMQ